MAGLGLLVVVAVGAVAQWHAPDGGTSMSASASPSAPDPSARADDAGISIGDGFIPDETTASATGQSTCGGQPADVDPATGVDSAGAGSAGAGSACGDRAGVGSAGDGSPSGDATGTMSVVDAATGLPVDAAPAPGPWWRRVLPIAGDLVPIRGAVRGNVRLQVVGEQVVQVTLTGVQVTAVPGSTRSHVGAVRVQLSAGDVIGTERAQWTGDDVPADFGSFTPDGEHPVLVIVDPQDLPPVVHSVLLVDADTGDLLGGAELLPVF
ncbi:hypothetical protein [Curtobacterium herbarum]|uniref:Bacterial spore germination immunoglobulin-like domain-containing protein n=1 Tax=Curtobacterium herbarum TaxID=150122 RepID=A0ABP4JZK8_9MICO|nr:hypothetical protein [Curtobacterium herbarum]MBM7475948.1 hypothetical protein [Curtobacterium herbarum]MCS6544483.1 hypothetical protein [Curtobacterium herbarum]